MNKIVFKIESLNLMCVKNPPFNKTQICFISPSLFPVMTHTVGFCPQGFS